MNRIMKRMALPIGAAAVLSTTGFAFMANNTVPTSYAGEGQGDVAGYTVSNVKYGENNNRVHVIEFDLDNASATHAVAWLVDGSGNQYQYGCDHHNPNLTHWICTGDSTPAGEATFANAETLKVRAYQ